jgi:transposase
VLNGLGIVSRKPFWLTEQQWSRIEPHLPADVRGKARVDDRRVISGIVHVLKSGCRWCDCPPERAGSVCLNSRLAAAKWFSAMVMLQPGLAAAQ